MNEMQKVDIFRNEALMEIIVKTSTEIASKQAIKEYEQEKKRMQREEQNRKLHNVETLLNNYTGLKEYVKRIDEKAKASISRSVISQETESLIELIEFSNDIVSAIKEQSQKSIVMVRHMDSALDALKYIYEQENNIRDFNILRDRYVHKIMPATLSEKYYLHKRSVQKILSKVRARYAVLLFGIYGVKLED